MFDFMGVADPEQPVPRMDPEARQRQLFDVVRRIVQARSRERRASHVRCSKTCTGSTAAAKRSSSQLFDAARGTRRLIVVNFRPEYHAAWMSKSYYHQLPLAPLGADAIRELLTRCSATDPSMTGLAAAIHARTAGNPVFTEEIVQNLIESGKLEGSGRLSPRDAGRQARSADSVHALLAARIDRLAEREKDVLQTAAVIGKQFAAPILAESSSWSPRSCVMRLHSLRRRRVRLRAGSLFPSAEYSFKHPLTQEVALGSQLESAAAPVTPRSRARSPRTTRATRRASGALAHHWEAAAATLKNAARWHARAAAWAMGSDAAQAFRHWWRVKELTAMLPPDEGRDLAGVAHMELVNVGSRGGRPASEIHPLFNEGRRILEENGDRRSLALLYSNYSLAGGIHCAQRVECSRNATRLAAEIKDVALQVAVGAAIFPLGFAGRVREALAQAEATLAMIPPGVDLGPGLLHFDPYPWLFSARGWCRGLLGDLSAAVTDSERGIELALRKGSEYDRLLAYSLRSRIDSWRGEIDGAIDHGRRQYEIAERIGGATNRLFAMAALGGALGGAQRFQEALPLLEQQAALTFELEFYQATPGLPTALLACGESERAVAAARQQLDYTVKIGGLLSEIETQTELATVLVLTGGDPNQVRVALERAKELVADTGACVHEPRIHETAASLHERLGESDARERELQEARRKYEAIGAVGHAQRVARVLG